MKLLYKTLLAFFVVALFSCNNEDKTNPINLFSVDKEIKRVESGINEELLGTISHLQSNDSSLVVYDFHSGKTFSLFNILDRKFIGRFVTIGQGPGEFPIGANGYLTGNDFYITYSSTGLIAKYKMDSLMKNIESLPITIANFDITDAYFSRICPLNDSLFLGVGAYMAEYQYVLFNSKSEVIDYSVEIFGTKDGKFNMHHKSLANQGKFKKHPTKNKFVFSLNNSSNIEFIEVFDSKIILIKSLKSGDPKYNPITSGEMYGVMPDRDCTIGYIDIDVDENYIYTLYTDKKIANYDGKDNTYSSKNILVFDWEGNPVHKYTLDNEAYNITVNEKLNTLYAGTKMEDGGWTIEAYDFN